MNRLALVLAVALLVLCGMVSVAAALHFRKVRAFVDDAALHFKSNPGDVKLLRAVGYPDGFLRAKIASGEFRQRSDAPRFLTGYARKMVGPEGTGAVEQYVFRVGLLPFEDSVILSYDADGRLVGMPVDGASWR